MDDVGGEGTHMMGNPKSSKKHLDLISCSVVKVHTTALKFDYEHPWLGPTIHKWHGSGFLVEVGGKLRLVTNAHVASDAVHIEIECAHDAKRYPATLDYVSDDADLATVHVDDPAFWEQARPLKLAGLPERGSRIQVLGFPRGGHTLSVTEGIVSRIEMARYAHSSRKFAVNQVSAAINPGNSGGPVINEAGQVVGVVHQGIAAGQNLGYMIPADILAHFGQQLERQEDGFPGLAIKTQKLESPYMRIHHGLPKDKSGICVLEIAKLSSAYGLLKEGDILLEMDGVPINNDGTIRINPFKKIHFKHLIQSKSLGEDLAVKVWRDGEEVDLTVPLLCEVGFSKRIIPEEHNVKPTYFIMSGQLVVQPVTRNFMDALRVDYVNRQKKHEDDQLIAINQFIDSSYTMGYRGFRGALIEEINGQKIHNIEDVVKACDSNTEAMHIIKTEKGTEIAIPNLGIAQEAELLARYHITNSRSEDLPIKPVMRSQESFESFTEDQASTDDSSTDVINLTDQFLHAFRNHREETTLSRVSESGDATERLEAPTPYSNGSRPH